MFWESENILNHIIEYLGIHFSLIFLAGIFPYCNCNYSSLLYSIHSKIPQQVHSKWIFNSFQCPNQQWLQRIQNKSQYNHIHAAQDGNITALTWILLKEFEWNSISFQFNDWILSIAKIAIHYNHLNILLWIDYATSLEFRFHDYFLCSDAINCGHYEIALWLHTKSCLWENRKGQLLSDALITNHINLFNWLLNNQQPLPKVPKLCTIAVQYHRFDMLEKLLKNSFPIEDQIFLLLIEVEDSKEDNNISLLQLIRSYKPIPISEKIFDIAVMGCKYDLLLEYFRGSLPFSGDIDYLTQSQRYLFNLLINEYWLWNFLSSCPPTPLFLEKYQHVDSNQLINSDNEKLFASFLHHLNLLEKFFQRLHYCINATRYSHISSSTSSSSSCSTSEGIMGLQDTSMTSIIHERDLRGVISYVQLESTAESYQISIKFLRDHLEDMINWIHLHTNYTVSWNTNNSITRQSSKSTTYLENSFQILTDIDPKWVKMSISDCSRRIQSLLMEYRTSPSIEILSEMSLFGLPIKLDEDGPELTPEQLMIKCATMCPHEGKYYARLHMWMNGTSCTIGSSILTKQQILEKALELSPQHICVLYASILSETNKEQRLRYQKLCFDLTGGSQTIHYFIKFAGSSSCNNLNKLEIINALHTLYYFEFHPSSINESTNYMLIHQDYYCRYKGNYVHYFREVFGDLLYRLSLLLEYNEHIRIHYKEFTIQSLQLKCCEILNIPQIIKKRMFRVYSTDTNQKLVWVILLVTGDICIFKKALRNEKEINLNEYGVLLATGYEGHDHNYQQVRESIRQRYGIEYYDCENIWKYCVNKSYYQLEKRK